MTCKSLTIAVMLIAAGCLSIGCAVQPENPSFRVTANAADADLARMTHDPHPLQRPLVVVTGFLDPGVAAVSLGGQFRDTTGDSRIAIVSLFECLSFEQCAQKIVSVVDHAFPCCDPSFTREVDVVGFSMGGLAARFAADPGPTHQRRLRINRLFTIDSPNQGADGAAKIPVLHPLQGDMRPGSPVVKRLNALHRAYRSYSYVRLGDTAIGLPNAAVPGAPLWWIPSPPLSNPHIFAFTDARIRADIARRLRGETPLASFPPAPLPQELIAHG